MSRRAAGLTPAVRTAGVNPAARQKGTHMLKTASVNYWSDDACAKAFWSQHELPPYRELLKDTSSWLEPLPLQRWLDLGCGSGQLTKELWTKSKGRLAEVVGMDVAALNELAYERLRAHVQPRPAKDRLRFVVGDFSSGLNTWHDSYFDGVVSGLALQYAESQTAGRWTTSGYDRILSEVFRILRPGGQFIFSVNVPNPRWGKVAVNALSGVFQAPRPLHFLKRAWRIWSYGSWLKRESRRGRFHYLPHDIIMQKLVRTGFVDTEHRTSFAGQAYIFRCRRPFAAMSASA